MEKDMHWSLKPFQALTPEELYQLLRLRSQVFVVEQQCVFLDLDNKDQQCLHLMGWSNENMTAYARLLPPGLSYDEASIGRVVSSPDARRQGHGRKLMATAITECTRIFGDRDIRIGAQLYLKEFYASFGFRQVSDTYLEDDILHIEMILSPQ
jgi:ElaA protein